MNCYDGEKTTRNRQAALSSVKSTPILTGRAVFVHQQQTLPSLFLSLPPYLQLLSAVGFIRRVLHQHPGLLFMIFVCHVGCCSSLLTKARKTPENVPLGWQFVHRAYFDADAVSSCGRRWASLLRSCTQDKDTERRLTWTSQLKIPFRSREASLHEKRLHSRPSGSADVFPEPSSRDSYKNSIHCNSSSVPRFSRLRDICPFHFGNYGPLLLISPVRSRAKVLSTYEPTRAADMRQNAPFPGRPLKASLRKSVKPVSDRVVPPMYSCPRMKGPLHNAQVVQSKLEFSTSAWPPAFPRCSPPVMCAPSKAKARSVNWIVRRGADTAIFDVTRGIPLRHALGKRNANALSATATVTVLPVRASPVTLHIGYLKSAHTTAASGVVPLLPPALHSGAFFFRDSCGRTSVRKQEPFLPATFDGSREGRYLVSSKDLEGNTFVEQKTTSIAALSQKERPTSDRAVDSGECSSTGATETRQRDNLLVGKLRENKPRKQGKKEIRLTPRIAAHDLLVKAKQARQFLLEKKQVSKVTI